MLKIKDITYPNGSPRFHISCDEKIVVKEKIHSKLVERDTEELFCESTNVPGVYHFGCMQLTASYDHGPGYVWSSRAGCINGQFGTQLYDDCVVDGASYWKLDIQTLKPLVEEFTGKKYIVEQYYTRYDENKEEPLYKFVEVK